MAILAKGSEADRDRAAACRAIPTTPTAATSRRRSTASSWAASTCPTAIRSPAPSSTTSSSGSSGSSSTRRRSTRSGQPVVLAGDYNVVPTDFDIYNPNSWRKDALLQPRERASATRSCSRRAGSTRSASSIPSERDLHVLGLLPQALGAQRGAAHRPPAAEPAARAAPEARRASTPGCAGSRKPSDHAPTWIVLKA